MGATLPPFLQFMSTALHRVIATDNPFKSPTTMAAAGNFYSIVAGVGAGTGRSVAIKFAQTYPVALLARNPANYESIVKEFKGKNLAAAVYNVGGKFVRKPFLELSLEEYEAGYEANGKGFFLFAQAVLPGLLSSVPTSPHPPSLIITGATASLRGGANMSSFASGKFALRATGQSLAR